MRAPPPLISCGCEPLRTRNRTRSTSDYNKVIISDYGGGAYDMGADEILQTIIGKKKVYSKQKERKEKIMEKERKEKKEWIELTERDKRILNLLEIFRAMTIGVILLLTGMKPNYGRKRIQKLVRCGYLEKSMLYVNKPSFYSLTNKGLNAINSDQPYYSVQNDNAYHEAVIATCAAWLHLNHGIPLSDILTEREMKRQGIKFGGKERTRPDLYVPQKSLCLEYERHAKTNEKTRRKIENNASNCEKQLWVIEDEDSALNDKILKIAEENDYGNSQIMTISRQFIEQRLEEGVTDLEQKVFKDLL